MGSPTLAALGGHEAHAEGGGSTPPNPRFAFCVCNSSSHAETLLTATRGRLRAAVPAAGLPAEQAPRNRKGGAIRPPGSGARASLGGAPSSHFLGRFSVFAYVRRGFRTATEELRYGQLLFHYIHFQV